MEAAYDHIQEETLKPEEAEKKTETQGDLNKDIQDAYKAFTNSPWGARIGGFLGSVKKQGESYYNDARNEAALAGEEAFKGFNSLKSSIAGHARSMSASEPADKEGEEKDKEGSGDLIARFRTEAEKRLKDIQKAEDAADEALLRFGTNVRNFFRDAITVAPPTDEDKGTGKVLFESKDADGKRVVHASRFDAQLHVIHCSLDSFTKDPSTPEWEKWRAEGGFKAAQKEGCIGTDLDKYKELGKAMEKLVPEQVSYQMFWERYYFLRMVIESEDKRRKEILKDAANAPDEEIGWDEDSDSEPGTPQAKEAAGSKATANSSSVTLPIRKGDKTDKGDKSDKSGSPSNSQDDIEARSDASYDIVSGTASKTPGSPAAKEKKDEAKKDDDSDDDWE